MNLYSRLEILQDLFGVQLDNCLQELAAYHELSSLFHLMRAIACTPSITRATSLMRVKIARLSSADKTYCPRHCNEENERNIQKHQTKQLSFFFNLFYPSVSLNVVLLCMTSEEGENSKFGVNTTISLAYIKQSQVSL